VAPRIVFIGGGSYQWTPKLVLDIADTPSLATAEIVIEDIDPAPIPAMVDFVHHVARVRDVSLSATGTTDQRAALDGADFVVVCISTGALDSMHHDIAIPERFGIRQTVGDTVGPGGIMRGLRNIPVMLSIARDMEERCPDAWLLNLTNPMTTLTRSVLAHSAINAIGLCHEVTITQYSLSMLLGCDMRAMDLEVAGINHLPFITRLTIDGEDGLARLRALLDDRAALGAPLVVPGITGHEAVSLGGEFTVGSLLESNRVKVELFQRFGVLPAAGDRHLVEFFSSFLTEESGWGSRWGVELTSMDDRRAWLAHYQQEFAQLQAANEIPRSPSGEMVHTIIDAMQRDRPRHLPLNIANHGQVPDVPSAAVVESIVTVDGMGVRGRDVTRLPRVLAEQVRRVSAEQELVVEAAISGDRSTVLDAMSIDPLASRLDYDELARMTDEMLSATARWLPRFGAA
jgi:alpha-galactosidase/6-phospho-beta-glucosidase family protein